MTQQLVIDDPRRHSPDAVAELRGLLAAGGAAHADPDRKNFYELEGDSRVFYVCVYPSGHRVVLLATWSKEQSAKIPVYDYAAN